MRVAGAGAKDREEGQALSAQRRGDHATAVRLLQATIARRGGDPALHHNLGLSLRALGRLDEAIASFQTALAGDPSSPSTLGCLGNALKAAGRHEEAVAHHTRAVEIDPTAAESWSNLGSSYEAWGREQAALLSFEQAAKLRPSADLLANWAGALLRADHLDSALDVATRAVAADARHPRALLNLAGAQRAHARYEEAIATLRRALEIDAGFADAHFNLGLALLSLGRYADGWAERQWRHQVPGVRPSPHDGPESRWDGSPLAGRSLLLRPEQGLGDSLQFIRYAPLVKRVAGPAGGRVLFQAPPSLAPLMSRCRGVDAVVAPAVAAQPTRLADVEAPLLDLPYLLRGAYPEPPGETPYLSPDPQLVQRWRGRLAADGTSGPRVGIGWQGNPRYPEDRRRSIPLSHFLPVVQAVASLGGQIYVLQKGPGREQLGTLPDGLPMVDLGPELDEPPADGSSAAGAFMDTAAVIAGLDLVVTSDTALPHLAGALGARVWTLLAHAPDWRWGHTGPVTPWYPTMRLFRQPRAGDWQSVLAAAAAALPAVLGRAGGKP